MIFSKKTKQAILIIAISIFMLCILWTIFRGSGSERLRICAFLKNYGYDVYEDDLLFAYDNASTTIRAAIDKDDSEMLKLVEISEKGGFSSDVDRVGGVTLVLATNGDSTVYMYMLDGEFELCFIEHNDGTLKELS